MRLFRAVDLASALAVVFAAQAAAAFDWSAEGHVIRIASTTFPDQILFMLDASVGSCPAGTWLTYVPSGSTEARQIASAQWAASQLLAARAGNMKVAVFGNNTGCRIEHIHTI